MKKNFLIGLVLLGFLFSGCDSKSPIDSSVVAKKSVQNNKYEFVPQSFNLTTTNEKNISFKSTDNGLDFDEFKGKKAVLIDVFATWCPPCIEEIPVLKEIKEKYKDNFEIVSILFEQDKTKEEILEFIAKHGINYPITIGEENFRLAKELGDVKKVPEMFLFSKDGKFVKKFVGKIPKEEIEKYIKIAIEN
ncbi:TlpA family protein disulfide reductase [Arcobacter caeni]|uniref:Thioredoxin n=1 Tax=Arcobacter caeni TaxID=1912877 RepID=A0A363D5F5_9BACT|nr:TlpA disulfide reductase family protein [Arcobacter caeni]PUE66532.1 thioredoxin [Arcobacter caeni]